MKRVVVWNWTDDPSVIPVQKLADAGEIEVVAWFSRRGKRRTHTTKRFYLKPDLMLEGLAEQGVSRDALLDIPPAELAMEQKQFQDIYSRVNYSKGLDYFDHLNLFHLYYQYFTALLKDGNVDAVVYFTSPHAGPDFMLYCVAKRLGIETIVTLQSHVPNRFYCIRDLNDFGTFATSPDIGEPIELTIPRKFEKKHFYMEKIPNRRGWLISRFIRDMWWATVGGSQPLTWPGVFKKQGGRMRYTKLYKQHAVTEVDFTRKFVYFPLQLQPELTTTILGREFSDQLHALEQLAMILPDDWHIYAKENPKQGFQQRDRFFYERLKRIPNCHYIDASVDTYELLEKSRFVASITGTACWESVSGGKPALIFGNTWFKSLPGIVSWRPGLTVEDITGAEIDHAELEAAYSRTMSKTVSGIVDMAYKSIHPDYSVEKNGEHLTSFLRKVLNLSEDAE